jgi:signal transduction histidine kinase
MPDPPKYLLSALLLDLPDEQRAALERELVPFARSGALGELAADIAHDLANPLFAVLGLVELLLLDEPADSPARGRLHVVQQAGLELKHDLQTLLDYAPAAEGHVDSALDAATRTATALVRHGHAKQLRVVETYPAEPILVRCPAGELVQAALHLLAAARSSVGDAGGIEVDVAASDTHGVLRVRPAAAGGVGLVAASRIAADRCGSLEQDGDALVLRLPLWDQAGPEEFG